MIKKTFFVVVLLLAFYFVFLSINNNFYFSEKEYSLDEKIGEMIVLGFRGLSVDESSKIIKDINSYNIGGIILFDYDVPLKTFERNIESPEQTKKLIENIKQLTRKDLFVAVDVEGGYVNRLKPRYGFIELDSAQSMENLDSTEIFLKINPIAEQLETLGFNLNFAPVVDVNVNPENPVIGGIERSYSANPEKVYTQSKIFIEAMRKNNIISSIKHFPGHGSSKDDSHLGLVDITETYQKEEELYPYRKLIENREIDMVMTAHVINKEIDEKYPATLSPLFLQSILRNELNFNGVIVSDDMQMGAIVDHFGFEEAVIKSINAGCNLLIFSNNGQEYVDNIAEKAFQAIKNAVESGEISEDKIDESFDKIRELKSKYKLI